MASPNTKRGHEKLRGGMPTAARAKEVVALRERGYSATQIAKKLGLSERRIWQILAYARQEGMAASVIVIPEPMRPEQLAEPYRSMVHPPSAEGFERFYVEFSGYDYLPAHARQWVEDFFAHRYLLLNVPPGHAKTTIMAVWLPIYLLCGNRDEQIIIISKTGEGVRKVTQEMFTHLESNTKLLQVFGRFRPDNTLFPWRPQSGEGMVAGRRTEGATGDLSIQIRGSGQQILGRRATLIIADDITDEKIARSDTEREREERWFRREVLSRLVKGGRALVIGQRVHLRDIYGTLDKLRMTRLPGAPKLWHTIRYPAVLDWGNPAEGVPPKVLWPQEKPFEELMEQYELLGQDGFECLYQQNPHSEHRRLIQEAWIHGDADAPGCLDRDRTWGSPGSSSPASGVWVRAISVDPSPTAYWGIVVADVAFAPGLREFETVLLEVLRDKLQLREANEQLDRMIATYRPEYLIVEKNLAHFWLQTPEFQQISRRVRVRPHTTTRESKNDAHFGISSLAMDFRAGRVRFPYADAESRRMSDLLINEAMVYPQGDTDDVLMALWFLKYNARALVPGISMATTFRGGLASGFTGGWSAYWEDHERRAGDRKQAV